MRKCDWLGLISDTRGVTALEYGIIAGVLVTVVVSGFHLLGNNLSTKFVIVANHLT